MRRQGREPNVHCVSCSRSGSSPAPAACRRRPDQSPRALDSHGVGQPRRSGVHRGRGGVARSDLASASRGTWPNVVRVGSARLHLRHGGPRFTNNTSVDVGTGAALQVPSLRAVSFRAPYLHDGCAPALIDRFAAGGGGDKHGHTSQLEPAQIADLVAYLESL